jgi:hypothetical protein
MSILLTQFARSTLVAALAVGLSHSAVLAKGGLGGGGLGRAKLSALHGLAPRMSSSAGRLANFRQNTLAPKVLKNQLEIGVTIFPINNLRPILGPTFAFCWKKEPNGCKSFAPKSGNIPLAHFPTWVMIDFRIIPS